MDQKNLTFFSYFVLKGISDIPELQTPIFLLVLLLYLIIIGGNMTILLLICLDPHLHTPMYFFLGNLSILDIDTSVLEMLILLEGTLLSLLTPSSLTFISYVFIIGTIMKIRSSTGRSKAFYTCSSHLTCWGVGHSPFQAPQSILIDGVIGLSPDRAAQPSPDPPLLFTWHLSCAVVFSLRSPGAGQSSSPTLRLVSLAKLDAGGFSNVSDASEDMELINQTKLRHFVLEGISDIPNMRAPIYYLVLLLYLAILGGNTTILQLVCLDRQLHTPMIQTGTGRRKAFYTCSSHLTTVVLLCASLIFQYLKANSIDTLESNKMFSLFNTAAVPLLNPLIYSLKNKDVKAALRGRLKLTFTNHMEKTS
ncbi:olfactory receptor 8K3-like [Discoglossus pictus]